MPGILDLLTPSDKPALLGLSEAGLVQACSSALTGLGYKIHSVANHSDLVTRFSQASYQIVVLDEAFDGAVLDQHRSLQTLQNMPMPQRRSAVIFLIGSSFQTLDAMQAFQQSVHAVIHPGNIQDFSQIVQKVVAENDLFLNAYRELQARVTSG